MARRGFISPLVVILVFLLALPDNTGAADLDETVRTAGQYLACSDGQQKAALSAKLAEFAGDWRDAKWDNAPPTCPDYTCRAEVNTPSANTVTVSQDDGAYLLDINSGTVDVTVTSFPPRSTGSPKSLWTSTTTPGTKGESFAYRLPL